MPISNYSNGFPDGVTIHNFPYVDTQNANGRVYWVDANANPNSNPNSQGAFDEPFGTIDYAVGRCIANKGDKIYVAAGHTESVIAAGGLDLDVAGITIIFLGEGANRATIDFGTDVAADMDVDAANITLVNPRFTASIDALTGPIDVNAANFTIINGSYFDGTSIDTTDCIVTDENATSLKIHGWYYQIGDEGGTQKQSNIQLNGVDNCELWGIYIAGDFATGNIENVTDEVLNANFQLWYINSTNATPKPGLVLDANATGYADKVNIRIVSGTTYVSSVAKFNWSSTSLGYNADGGGGDPIGTAAGSSLEAKIDAIQADIGDPSARTNFQNLEDMIDVPDAANSNLDDMIRTGFDSSATTASADGSIMERLEFIQASSIPDMGGLSFRGVCDTGMGASSTTIVCAGLAGYGDDYFNTKYYMQVIKNTNSVGASPEPEVRQITDYVSTSGTFTVTAFGANVEETDEILVAHEAIVAIGRDDNDNTIATTNVAANADGSILERQEFNQVAVAAIQTDLGDPSARTNFQDLENMIGIPDAANSNLDDILRTGFDSSATTAGADGSVMERLEFIQSNSIPDLGGLSFRGACDSGMGASATVIVCADLAGYGDDYFNTKYYMQIIKNANSVGASPEPEIRQVTDYVSATGTFTCTAFGANVEEADSIMVAHESVIAIGRDDNDNTIATTNVAANADGSILERQEFNQVAVAAVQTDIGDPSARTNFQDIENMIGIPDAANSNLNDMLNTGFDSSAVTAGADGSVMERLEFIQANSIPDLGGLSFRGACDTGMTGSTTTIVCADLAGYGDDYFNTKYFMQVIKNTNSVGNAPETQVRQITDYVSTTGTFTVTAFGANAEEGDSIMVAHESIIMIGRDDADNTIDTSNVAANADGSLAERQEYIQGQVNKVDGATLATAPTANSLAAFIASGGTGLGTELDDSKSLIDAIGSNGTTLAYGSGSTLGAYGTVCFVAKLLLSSAVLQAGVDITGTCTGTLLIEDIVMSTDGTGLATGTNFTIETDNNLGVAVFLAETVANLGVQKTVNLAAASVTSIGGVVLEAGKKLIAKSTVADCTGAGTITIVIKFRRVTEGATVAAA